MRMRWRAALCGAVLALPVGCADPDTAAPIGDIAAFSRSGNAVAAATPQRNFVAVLASGDAGTNSPGRGVATFRLAHDGAAMAYRLNVANIENLMMAHIHLAPAASDGPVVVWLYPAGPPPQLIQSRFQGVLATGTITAADLTGPLAGMTLADLVETLEAGLGYVNVHTAQHPGGEIRGQITIPSGR